jgi:hypothetical protein
LGTLPDRLLEYNFKLVSDTMSPIDVGIFPINLLLKEAKKTNLFNLPISDGILPSTLLEPISKYVNETIFPIDVGIFPFNLLL